MSRGCSHRAGAAGPAAPPAPSVPPFRQPRAAPAPPSPAEVRPGAVLPVLGTGSGAEPGPAVGRARNGGFPVISRN